MKREFLEELLKSIEDETSRKDIIDKIMNENGNSINSSKSKIDELNEQLGLKTKEHEEATKLIEQLKESSKGNEELQTKITDYEGQVAALQKELEETKIESALKVALVNAKVTDVDYIAYKVKEKIKDGEKELKLDENGNIKGIDDTLKDIKTAYPNFFETTKKKEIDVKDLGKGEVKEPEPTNLVEALTQKYNDTKNEM